ncbi:MAG TPA: four helix bundle protein [Candidatus Eisenbacteria bacterium]|nr:four helix bundle protein [Candidatus Eisenbacteria bacterium]
MKNYEELEVWQKAHALTLQLYRETEAFPRSEMFGLTSQIRRAAGSIGANLAEGCGRWNEVELARYVQIAMGSASELQNHLRLARDLGFLSESDYGPLLKALISIRRMLTTLLQTLRRTRNTPTPASGEWRMAKGGKSRVKL